MARPVMLNEVKHPYGAKVPRRIERVPDLRLRLEGFFAAIKMTVRVVLVLEKGFTT